MDVGELKMKNKKGGFTLVELVIAMGILAFVLMTFMALFIYTSVAGKIAGNKTLAVAAAQNKIEEIRNQTFDNIATMYSSAGTPGNTFTPAHLNGVGTVSIDSSTADIVTIQVSVSWTDKYNRAMPAITLITMLSKR